MQLDFQKLKKCNDICFKWSAILEIKQRDYVRFCLSAKENHIFYLEKLPTRLRNKFLKDCKVMFYAAEVEDEIITKYRPMVLNILKKLNIAADEFEEHEVTGLLAIRTAVWSYRTHEIKASFTTYCHNSIFNRIRGIKFKDYQKNQRRKDKLKIYSYSDLTDDFQENYLQKEYRYYENETIQQQVSNILKEIRLPEHESFLLECFSKREEVENWIIAYNEKYGTKYTLNSIRRILIRVQKKVFVQLSQKDRLPDGYQPKAFLNKESRKCRKNIGAV